MHLKTTDVSSAENLITCFGLAVHLAGRLLSSAGADNHTSGCVVLHSGARRHTTSVLESLLPNAGSVSGQRRRRWPYIEPALEYIPLIQMCQAVHVYLGEEYNEIVPATPHSFGVWGEYYINSVTFAGGWARMHHEGWNALKATWLLTE